MLAHLRGIGEKPAAKRSTPPHRSLYEAELLRLQAELAEMVEWVRATGARVPILRADAAGKGGAIKRGLSPPAYRAWSHFPYPLSVSAPSGTSSYIAHLPAAGEIRLFDRSWRTTAAALSTPDYCIPEEHRRLQQQPGLERGCSSVDLIHWFSVPQKAVQTVCRMTDPSGVGSSRSRT